MRKPPFFHTVPSTARLQPDPGVPARIRKAAAALRALPREALTPSEAWIEDNAAPLLREASSRIREARQLPPLPALSGTPREVFSDAERLAAYRLDVPPMARIAQALRQKGMPIADGVLTVSDMAKEVARLCK